MQLTSMVTIPSIGADDDIPVTLEPGEDDEDNNFVEDPNVGTISGLVVNDLLGADAVHYG